MILNTPPTAPFTAEAMTKPENYAAICEVFSQLSRAESMYLARVMMGSLVLSLKNPKDREPFTRVFMQGVLEDVNAFESFENQSES